MIRIAIYNWSLFCMSREPSDGSLVWWLNTTSWYIFSPSMCVVCNIACLLLPFFSSQRYFIRKDLVLMVNLTFFFSPWCPGGNIYPMMSPSPFQYNITFLLVAGDNVLDEPWPPPLSLKVMPHPVQNLHRPHVMTPLFFLFLPSICSIICFKTPPLPTHRDQLLFPPARLRIRKTCTCFPPRLHWLVISYLRSFPLPIAFNRFVTIYVCNNNPFSYRPYNCIGIIWPFPSSLHLFVHPLFTPCIQMELMSILPPCHSTMSMAIYKRCFPSSSPSSQSYPIFVHDHLSLRLRKRIIASPYFSCLWR